MRFPMIGWYSEWQSLIGGSCIHLTADGREVETTMLTDTTERDAKLSDLHCAGEVVGLGGRTALGFGNVAVSAM